ncbi:hypothetical protein [Falsirhodobacter halotolerans]|uniref:hypothetical protein n=1 Tax=Falsirhodobacter halotolerans TaxID=1146892 RepID=UPI001FD559F0|nr:hypothetical protein [Falsirhodobacter halotolerans]MCJ8139333.1 hypothetical protein [Falsirhodobacter halotolerans]
MFGVQWIFGGIIAALAGLFAAFQRGRASGRKVEQDKAAHGYADTRKDTDNADIQFRPGDARSWLHKRPPNQR